MMSLTLAAAQSLTLAAAMPKFGGAKVTTDLGGGDSLKSHNFPVDKVFGSARFKSTGDVVT